MPNTTYGTPYAQSSDLVSNWPGVSSNVADRIDDVSFKGNGLNDQTGTSYTLVLTDAGKTVTLNNAAAVTVTIPTNASVAYETGTVIEFTNKGAGVVTISPAGGVTLNNSVTLPQNASASIQKLDTNTWVMVGGQPPGLTLITSSSFSAVSSVSVNNCFSATYRNYRLIISLTAVSTTLTLTARLRTAGSDNSNATYQKQTVTGSGATVAAVSTSNATSFQIGTTTLITQSGAMGNWAFDVFAPELSTVNTVMAGATHFLDSGGSTVAAVETYFFNATTAFDGFSLLASTGTITGTVRVYGYRNS